MKTGEGRAATDILHRTDGACDTIVINRDALEGFIIVYDFTTDVQDDDNMTMSNVLAITSATPNPFSSSTNIALNVPTTSQLTVEVFDAVGNKVATLANEVYSAGKHNIEWDGTANGVSIANGTYTVRITDGVTSATQQIVLVR